jgi:hypothetical protein
MVMFVSDITSCWTVPLLLSYRQISTSFVALTFFMASESDTDDNQWSLDIVVKAQFYKSTTTGQGRRAKTKLIKDTIKQKSFKHTFESSRPNYMKLMQALPDVFGYKEQKVTDRFQYCLRVTLPGVK